LLLGQYHLENHNYYEVIAFLEPLLSTQLAPEQRVQVLRPLIKAWHVTDSDSNLLGYLPEALQYATEQADLPQQAHFHELLGHTYTNLYVFHKALEHLFKNLELRQAMAQPQALGNCYVAIGWTYFSMKDHTKAKQYFLMAHELATTHHDQRLAARALGNLAIVYGELKAYQTAQSYHLKVIEVFQTLQTSSHVAIGYGNIAVDYCNQEDFANALPYFDKALALLEKHPNKGLESWLYTHLGRALIDTNLETNEKCTQAFAVQLDVLRLEQERESYKQKTVELAPSSI
jgi:tetratricopeptide (TPR) repeat protein